jgi:hypothetical protein
VLLALLAVLALPAAVPAAASASITPSLTLAPSTVSAGTIEAQGFDVTFSPSGTDFPTSLSLALPPGLLLDTGLDGGACLNSATPTAGCELGSGTATSTLPSAVSLWIVQAPSASDVAGLALEDTLGTVVGTGDIALTTAPDAGLNVSFTTLPADLTALGLTLSTVRAPTTCPSTFPTVGVSAISDQVPTPVTSTTPLPMTGCGSLPYAPQVAATVDQDDNGTAATFAATVTGAATESATQALEVEIPSSVSPNVSAALGCLLGRPCTIGTVSAISPLLPASALSDGTVQLGGSVTAPTLTVTFPPPYAITVTGAIDISADSLTFSAIPDLPLTSLTLEVGGGSSTQFLTTNCAPSALTTELTPWDGAAQQTISTPITFGGTCPATPTAPPPTTTGPAKPTVSGASLGGLVKRVVKLAFTVKEGTNGRPIKRIAMSLPKGLSFSRARANLAKGSVVRGSRARKVKFSASVRHGVLTITLSSAAPTAEITLESPAVTVSSTLATSVKKELEERKVGALDFKLRLTDSSRTATGLALDLKPKS